MSFRIILSAMHAISVGRVREKFRKKRRKNQLKVWVEHRTIETRDEDVDLYEFATTED
jgi:hypothetical protein